MKQKSENRKAMPKFILIIIGAFLLGGLLGVGIVFAEGDWTRTLGTVILNVLIAASPYILVSTALVNAGTTFVLYRKAKKLYESLGEEDEGTLEQINRCLNPASIVNSVCTIVSYFIVAVPFGSMEDLDFGSFLICLGAFMCNMVIMLVGQQKIVDFLKKLNPEKRGSVYDMKFSKTWYESCDEMERAIICQAAWTAYKATSGTCVLLWLVLVLGNMLFDFGLLPIAVVSLIWLVSSLSYSIKAAQLERRKI